MSIFKGKNKLAGNPAEKKPGFMGKFVVNSTTSNMLDFGQLNLDPGVYKLVGTVWCTAGSGLLLLVNGVGRLGRSVTTVDISAVATVSGNLPTPGNFYATDLNPRIGVFFQEGRGTLDCTIIISDEGHIFYASRCGTVAIGRQRVSRIDGVIPAANTAPITRLGVMTESSSVQLQEGTTFYLFREDV